MVLRRLCPLHNSVPPVAPLHEDSPGAIAESGYLKLNYYGDRKCDAVVLP